jgi:alpha-beta hydrolase superfamily lysophospholipase
MSALLKISSAVLTVLLATQVASARICPSPWQSAVGNTDDCDLQEFTLNTWSGWTGLRWQVQAHIRSGYLAENPQVPFRGNVIYFEGLADSMVNHMPLFQKLTDAGYRVIAFDYMGQGGSSGTMNDTRIYEIGALGDKIWNLHARDLTNYPKKNIIGWSTGGLAAYVHARIKTDVNNIVLIAPGIAPNIKVGEQQFLKFKFNQITLPTLTTQVYTDAVDNPHLDPIKPRSPLDIMDFSWDLTVTAAASRAESALSERVNGFVLLSGDKDTYVNARKTFAVLKKIAPHFSVRQYPNSLHEIDNEAEPNRSNAHRDILDFLNRNNY